MQWNLTCTDGTSIALPEGEVFAHGVLLARIALHAPPEAALAGVWDLPPVLFPWFGAGHQVGLLIPQIGTASRLGLTRPRVPLNLRDDKPSREGSA